jgi:hypothetical protein
MGLALSLWAFVVSFLAGNRSLGAGCSVVLAFGYGFGLLRARFYDSFSYFIFDAAVLGLYLARFVRPGGLTPEPDARPLFRWTAVLIGWPVVLFALFAIFPQHPLIQLVGLRSAIWYLPFLLLGASFRPGDLTTLARTLAVLNMVALAFALGEFVLGLEPFYPKNPITALIYRSSDVGSSGAHRIPATFSASGLYGGTVVGSIPLLVGLWTSPSASRSDKLLMVAGMLAASLGAFVCGSRTPVVFLLVLAGVIAFQMRARLGYLALALLVAATTAYIVSSDARFQRFATLQDPDVVAERLSGSLNMTVVDVMSEYPLGAGLGSAFGTNIPPMLLPFATNQIGAENEYARFGVEQGWIGLTLWVAFLIWIIVTGLRTRNPLGGALGARLMYCLVVGVWGNALLGAGILAAIPGAALLLIQMALLTRPAPAAIPPAVRRPRPAPGAAIRRPAAAPANTPSA